MRFVSLLFLLSACARPEAPGSAPMVVGAPSAQREVFDGVLAAFKARHPEASQATVIYGTPEALLGTGAFIDVIATDSQDAFRPLLPKAAEKRDWASNPLCLVTKATAPELRLRTMVATPWAMHIALGDSRSDPAGMAAEAALGRLGVRRAINDKLRYLSGSTDVIADVAAGRSEAGLAFAADVALSPDAEKLKIADRAPDDPRWRYPVAIISGTQHPAQAREFIDELLHGKGPELIEKKGLLPPQ
jgi:molybdate transport system substrate-binding protein